MKTLEVHAQPQPNTDASDVMLNIDADVSGAVSTRCAIHGTEMDYQQGNTYFCAACLGLSDKRHSRQGNSRDRKKDAPHSTA